MILYPYQQKSINEIIEAFRTHRKVMYQLSTGGGKTFIFSYLTKMLDEQDKRVLILVDRTELVDQTVKSLNKIGVVCESLISNKRKLKHYSNVYVGMIETSYNRLSKDDNFFRNIDLLIIDEAHMLSYNKIFPFFESSKLLGCTATPVVLKRETFYKCDICKTEHQELTNCCGGEVMEWTRPFTFGSIYDTIICGPEISELIEKGNLVQELSFVKKSVDISGLKTDKTGEITTKSQDHAFGSNESILKLVKDYENQCKGKKVMIFTGSTKINTLLKNAFSNYNARIFDTVNSDDNRKEVVNWFKESSDGILISTGVFTKGFDVKDVEVIILYRSTKSLALYIQIVGRGARTYPGKFNFLFIDYGCNIQEHGEFSDPTRDWKKIFYRGTGEAKPKREVLESVTQCENCGILYPSSFSSCTNCGELPKTKKKRAQKGEDYVLEPIRPMPSPSGNRIVEYAISQKMDVNFAFKVLENQIIDLFRFYSITNEVYERSKKTGELDRKLEKIIRPAFFVIIKSELEGANRRLKRVMNDIKTKIEKYYDQSKLIRNR